MKIAIGADHAGFLLKQELVADLQQAGHSVTDVGTFSTESTDYPDYAAQVGNLVAAGGADYGVLVCSTGVGMSIAANKIHGIRAALAMNADEVRFSRAHNNANVVTFGSKYYVAPQAMDLIGIFLGTPFEGGRHERRVEKICALDDAR